MDANLIEAGHRFRRGGSLGKAADSADNVTAEMLEVVGILRKEHHPGTERAEWLLRAWRDFRATSGLPGARGVVA